MFITFSLIELVNVGAGLIDGLFATGMQTLCTRELGRGDVRAFNRLFSAVMILDTVFSAALTVVLLLSAVPLAMLLGASGKGAELVMPAAQYLRGIGIGLPGLIMVGVLSSAIQYRPGYGRCPVSAGRLSSFPFQE